MLFHVTWEFRAMTEDDERRFVAVFPEWQPPAETDFKAFYNYADLSGGVAIVDVDGPATLTRTIAPWLPWLRFTATPIQAVPDTIAIRLDAIAFRDSVT